MRDKASHFRYAAAWPDLFQSNRTCTLSPLVYAEFGLQDTGRAVGETKKLGHEIPAIVMHAAVKDDCNPCHVLVRV